MPHTPALQLSQRLSNGRFGAGNAGRPRGARNRVAQRVAIAILDDFEAHQNRLLNILRENNLELYVRLLSRLLPRSADVGLPDYADFSQDELADRIEDIRLALEFVEKGEGTLLDVEGVLVGETEFALVNEPEAEAGSAP